MRILNKTRKLSSLKNKHGAPGRNGIRQTGLKKKKKALRFQVMILYENIK